MAFLMSKIEKNMKNQRIWVVLSLLWVTSVLTCLQAFADPNDYVVTPKVERGEREIDFKSGNQINRDGTMTSANSLGLGYGVNDYWFTEVYAKYMHEANQSPTFDAWEWENKFQLTPNQSPVIVGVLLEIEKPKDTTEGYELTYGPLLQTEWGKLQGNLNLLIQRNLAASSYMPTEFHYQGQLKYKSSRQFQWGLQALGNMGTYNHWSSEQFQEHKIGPALFGKIMTNESDGFKWNAAWLKGYTNATPTSTLRLQIEYEFY
jgi:hypothetical protein